MEIVRIKMGWEHYFCFKNVNQANSNPVHESTTVPFLGLASISFPGPFPWLEGGVGKAREKALGTRLMNLSIACFQTVKD